MRSRLFFVAALTFGVSLLAIDARSTYGARVSSDEPQYLLTAMSLAEDRDLDISDEIKDERYRVFHEVQLDQQTIELNDAGQELSPHDPLLPLILAVPYAVGGWVGAKMMLSAIMGATAALTLLATVRRLGADPRTSTWIISTFFAAPPLTSYGTHIFPAGPAALCLVLGFLAVTHEKRTRLLDLMALAAIVALPWLSVKYVPHAAVIAAGLAWKHKDSRARLIEVGGVLAFAGITYLAAHQGIYGGWTVYAASDHFVGSEFEVVGRRPRLLPRTRRLIGLLIDKQFGVAAWTPSYLLMPPSLCALARARRDFPVVLAAGLIAVGWAIATWVAFTMHGWWWPGRQVTPILPFVVMMIATWVGERVRAAVAVAAASTTGAATWLFLAWESSTDRRALIVDFYETANPWYQAWSAMLPNHQRLNLWDSVLTFAWLAVIGTFTYAAYRRAGSDGRSAQSTSTTVE